MKRSVKAKVGGAATFLAIYTLFGMAAPIVPEGVWIVLLGLLFAAFVADQIDPVEP